ncbi:MULTISPECIES: preprotein translocase subunit YajC [Acidipropionibacterium]|uniref:preprotein translocase subunit YajC n=1 Tax=Acidipropionibacterium TaxID=1912215 RepID=UPI0003F8C6E1|nr:MULTISPECIES: preprotein translocase subunit YajC [Acidipropionibacterium]
MPLLASLGGLMPMVIVLILFLGLMSFTTRRNMKKQKEARQQMENSMGEGSRVMLTSGIYGTITHIGDKQAIVELAPGAEIVVVKQAISKVVEPSEEEFSFADEAAAPVVAGTVEPAADQSASPADELGVAPEAVNPQADVPATHTKTSE